MHDHLRKELETSVSTGLAILAENEHLAFCKNLTALSRL